MFLSKMTAATLHDIAYVVDSSMVRFWIEYADMLWCVLTICSTYHSTRLLLMSLIRYFCCRQAWETKHSRFTSRSSVRYPHNKTPWTTVQGLRRSLRREHFISRRSRWKLAWPLRATNVRYLFSNVAHSHYTLPSCARCMRYRVRRYLSVTSGGCIRSSFRAR